VQRVNWSSVGSQLSGGGLRFFTVLIFGDATATVTRDTSTAMFVRYRP